MRLVIFSRTPLAAAPWELYKAIKKYTHIDVSLINEVFQYADGRSFPHHLLLMSNNGQAIEALRAADLWHVHNYLTRRIEPYRNSKKVLAQFHSVPRLGNWQDLMRFADVSFTIKQPLQEKEYRLPGLPNIIDPDEYYPGKREKKIKIAFAPTSRAHPGRPDSKGYFDVKNTLQEVASKRDVDIVWIEGREYLANLQLKKESHILIDDVVTGNWHRTSLEGACFGCAVVNRINKVPFVSANLDNLEERLLWLIDNRTILAGYQERSRLWALQHYHAMDQIKLYERAYKRLLDAR